MTRKEQLDQEYRAKRAAGGFDAPTAAEAAASRRGPVKRRWKGTIIVLVLLIGVAAVCWQSKPWAKESAVRHIPSVSSAGGRTTISADSVPVSDEQLVSAIKDHLDYLLIDKMEFDQIVAYVRSAPIVVGNVRYKQIMENVFVLPVTNHEVNAYAHISENNGRLVRRIMFTAGSSLFCRLSSLAVAASDMGDKKAVSRFVASLKYADYSNFTMGRAARILRDAGLLTALSTEAVRTKARSVAAGMVIGVLGHEVGHQVLGHMDGNGRLPNNVEISRNQEREADSFANSVIASSPFGEYVFSGTLLWHYALACKEEQEGITKAGNHPLERERVGNLIRANPEKAAEMGIVLK